MNARVTLVILLGLWTMGTACGGSPSASNNNDDLRTFQPPRRDPPTPLLTSESGNGGNRSGSSNLNGPGSSRPETPEGEGDKSCFSVACGAETTNPGPVCKPTKKEMCDAFAAALRTGGEACTKATKDEFAARCPTTKITTGAGPETHDEGTPVVPIRPPPAGPGPATDGGGRITVASVDPATATCTDVVPTGVYNTGPWTCPQFRDGKHCDEAWMIENNWCTKTCNRCGAAPGVPASPAAAGSATPNAGTVPPALCNDTQPPPSRGNLTCPQYASAKRCGESWLVEGRFCQESCGVCR